MVEKQIHLSRNRLLSSSESSSPSKSSSSGTTSWFDSNISTSTDVVAGTLACSSLVFKDASWPSIWDPAAAKSSMEEREATDQGSACETREEVETALVEAEAAAEQAVLDHKYFAASRTESNLHAWSQTTTIPEALKLYAPLATGLILVSCYPGGRASNVATYISKANVALSVLMTTWRLESLALQKFVGEEL